MKYYEDIKTCTQAFLEGVCIENYRSGNYTITLHGHPKVIDTVAYWEKWRYAYEPSKKEKGLHRVTYMSNCGVKVRLYYRFEPPFDSENIIGISD